MSEFDEALSKSKIGLLHKRATFLSTIAFSLDHVTTDAIDDSDVSANTIQYNPEYFMGLSHEMRQSVIAHKTWHVALGHHFRGVGKDPKTYGKAADYVVNQLLKESGYQLGEDWLQDDCFSGKSTEEVYKILYEEDPNNSKDDPMGNGQGIGDGAPNDIVEGNENAGDGTAAGNAAALKQMQEDISDKVMQAATASEMSGKDSGSIPGEILRDLENFINPRLPWDQLLDKYLSDKAKDDYSYLKPNKRFMPDHILPSAYSETLGTVTIAIDTSGSISDKMLHTILSEIAGIKEKYDPKEMIIIDCDARINHIHYVDENTSIEELEFTGGGGTSFHPVIEFCEENPPEVLLYFTDLWATQIQEEQPYDIIWLCWDADHEPAPIGETIYYDG